MKICSCGKKFETHFSYAAHKTSCGKKKVKCNICSKEFYSFVLKHHQKTHQRDKKCLLCEKIIFGGGKDFCNHSCAAKYRYIGRERFDRFNKCLNCLQDTKTPYKLYCSKDCLREYNYKTYIERWLRGELSGNDGSCPSLNQNVRKWLFRTRGERCEVCGWNQINPKTKRSPLNIEHIDGCSENTRPENLKILCPNCHSLTPTYGSLNRGRGRKNRYHK